MDKKNITVEEAISATSDCSVLEGLVNPNPHNDQVAPLGESTVKIMVELTGSGSVIHRPGLDLVAVLDVSRSMGNDQKLEKLIMAMQFLIRKLTRKDRLSIVTFSNSADIVCGLRVMTDSFKSPIEDKVKALRTREGTNITDGLKTGLRIINTRNFTDGRVAGIMLLSDGEKKKGKAADVKDNIDSLPVFTFSFGENKGAGVKVLRDIAQKSRGGTLSDVRVLDNLNQSFAQILAGLVTVIVQDLKLTLRTKNSTKITDVCSGSYVKNPNTENLVTVLFGYLYGKETRRVMVELLLPRTEKSGDMNVLEITYSYSVGSQQFKSHSFFVFVKRTLRPVPRENKEETLEKKRLDVMKQMKEARRKAENKNLTEAKKMLHEAQKLLRGVGDKNNPLIKTLKYELTYLLKSVESLDAFKLKGLPFALSSETSHESQRFAARGNPEQVRLFATPRMTKYRSQAKEFDEDQTIRLRTANEDAKQELDADPDASINRAIAYHNSVIQSLKSRRKSFLYPKYCYLIFVSVFIFCLVWYPKYCYLIFFSVFIFCLVWFLGGEFTNEG